MPSRIVDANRNSPEAQVLLETFRRRVVGQEEALQTLVNIVENYKAGFSDPRRPAGNALFLGPTGTGKTLAVESMCAGLFGSEQACLKIDCAEFQHSHEIAKLVGSPPGYIGHRETHPVLTQEVLAAWHTEKNKLSVVLFDEIEKASDSLWLLLLGILDKATVTLGDNRKVNFSQVIIIMTSNLGSSQMENLVNGGMGFVSDKVKDIVMDSQLSSIAKEAAKKKFSPEFFNRIEHVSVFRTLSESQIAQVLSMELGRMQSRLLENSNVKFFFHLRGTAREKVLKEGFDRAYNARHLRRALERMVLTPMARLVASGQVEDRDVIIVEDVGLPDLQFSISEQKL